MKQFYVLLFMIILISPLFSQPPGGRQSYTPTFNATLLAAVANEGQNTHNFQSSGGFTNVAASVSVKLQLRKNVSPANTATPPVELDSIRLVESTHPQANAAGFKVGVIRNGADGSYFGGISSVKEANKVYDMRVVFLDHYGGTIKVYNFGTENSVKEWGRVPN